MRTYTCIFIVCLVFFGCSRDFTEYELDESSFGTDTIARIEKESGVDLPSGVKGLKFHYIPPIDPIVFAKIKIPAEAGKLMKTRIAALTNKPFPKNFANDRCKWWPSSTENAIISRTAFNNGYYIEAHLIQEKEQLILYLKYYTM